MALERGIAGPITGIISAADPNLSPVGSTNLLSGVLGYDLVIADMGFRIAASTETPYQRETAEFRKEQFDAAPVVGEQSLDGWWLRSQLSFHHGAGIKFYEVLEGETVFNRYRTASGVDPWTPGEVTLVDGFSTPAGASIVDAVPGELSGVTGVFALTSSGVIEFWPPGGAATTITTGGTATSITTSGSTLYAAVGNTIKVQDGTTTLATLWTHTDLDVTWQRLWYAKGRLFAVDSDDKWYTLPKSGGDGTVGAADAEMFWDPGATPGEWVLTETPAFVLIGNGTDIYAITLSATGSVPDLTAPTVVAQVPIGETIAALHHYLGFVVICTQAGLRVGQATLSDSTPVLVFGPLLIEGDFSTSKRLAAFGSEVYAIGDHEDYEASTIFSVNLEQQVSDLRPAWTAHAELGDAVAANQGCVIDADGLMWAWVNSEIQYQDPDAVVTGTLTTGQLRFGTMEPKSFRSVLVRAAGEGGTIGISSVLPDGTTRSILTMDLSAQKQADLTLSLSAPIESVGLQFLLKPDPLDNSKRPTLLGYQIRGLPAPKRQRVIRAPLEIMDSGRNRYGVDRGHDGDAWERLRRLEDMESSQVIVSFIDFRTGEAGVAQIDRVTFQGSTPSKNAEDNFGGIAYVELRKVS